MNSKKLIKRSLWFFLGLFIVMNVVAFFHAYKFTHFAQSDVPKTKNPKHLSSIGKLKALAFGVDNPRPVNKAFPKQKFQTIKLKSNKTIECWIVRIPNSKGTVILFHGFSGDKSMMIDKSDIFLSLGYNTMLVDFMGSGGSEGNQTTIGFKEAVEVKTCFDHLKNKGEQKIYLFGTSQGAVAVLKALYDYPFNPSGIIVECPFGSMYKTTCARFRSMNAPTFPMAGLLVFWGGIQNDFWAFGHNPTKYAEAVCCPTLLMYGEKDKTISRDEIDKIYVNLKGEKRLRTYALAGHENYLKKYRIEWEEDVKSFLNSNE